MGGRSGGPRGRSGELVARIRRAGLSDGSGSGPRTPADPTTAVAHGAPTKVGSGGVEAGSGGGEPDPAGSGSAWMGSLGLSVGFSFFFFFIFIN